VLYKKNCGPGDAFFRRLGITCSDYILIDASLIRQIDSSSSHPLSNRVIPRQISKPIDI
jgi:hypothetical protein